MQGNESVRTRARMRVHVCTCRLWQKSERDRSAPFAELQDAEITHEEKKVQRQAEIATQRKELLRHTGITHAFKLFTNLQT